MTFEPYLSAWRLQTDGEPIVTPGSRLLPVRLRDLRPAMLKIAIDAEEKFGALLMHWWDGDGAAQVYAHEGDALLLERAQGTGSLMHMALNGQDDEASRIACTTVARLHAPRSSPPPELVPLQAWFAPLDPAAQREGGILIECAAAARALLATPRDVGPLHGDVHHDNILDFGPRGWLAIDPKRVVGERGFDYANLLCNPDLPTSTIPARLLRQSRVIAQAAGLERQRLLQWTLAFAGLSAAWFLEDGDAKGAAHDFGVADITLRALKGERAA